MRSTLNFKSLDTTILKNYETDNFMQIKKTVSVTVFIKGIGGYKYYQGGSTYIYLNFRGREEY